MSIKDKFAEDNKLIAEFMGLEIITDGISYFDKEFKSLKNYHESWDCLMPVVETINILDDYRYTVTIVSMDVEIIDNFSRKIVFLSECKWDCDQLLKAVYEAVLEFVKYYNKL
jgi:hypothetical protein